MTDMPTMVPGNAAQVLQGKKIALVCTVPFFLVQQLSAQIRHLWALGMQVTIITSPEPELAQISLLGNLQIVPVVIPRKLQPLKDIVALYRLVGIFRRYRFDIVHSTTPKAGLLCAIAGKVAGISLRFHAFTGQPWVTQTGLMRAVLQIADRVITGFNTHCYADSPSQRQMLIDMHIASESSISVLGSGSLAGVDLGRFDPRRIGEEEKANIRTSLGIVSSVFVITFIGRLTADKGVPDLLSAFAQLHGEKSRIHLLILGRADDASGMEIVERATSIPNVHYVGYVKQPERYLAITDILCLPSYREGFGTVVIEAAAMGVPAIGTRIPGLVDAIIDGETGLLVPVRDVSALKQALERLADDADLLRGMKIKAKARSENEFDADIINHLVAGEYVKWLQADRKAN